MRGDPRSDTRLDSRQATNPETRSANRCEARTRASLTQCNWNRRKTDKKNRYQDLIVKPKVYIETSILSYLTARLSNDLRVAANQSMTIEWWETRRSDFELFISELVIAETGLGDSDAAQKRLEVIDDLPRLTVTESVKILAQMIISEGVIPNQEEQWKLVANPLRKWQLQGRAQPGYPVRRLLRQRMQYEEYPWKRHGRCTANASSSMVTKTHR